MKINITKEQYKQIVDALGIATGILGVSGDMISEEKYKKRAEAMQDVEDYILTFADTMGCPQVAERDDMESDYYVNEIMPIIDDYEGYATFDHLSTALAWRDFLAEHTKEEVEALRREHSGYLGVPLYPYEKKYWDEFEKHDYNRLYVKKIGEM